MPSREWYGGAPISVWQHGVAGYIKLVNMTGREPILNLERIVADLKQERDRLSRAIGELEGTNSSRTAKTTSVAVSRPPVSKGKKRGGLTPEGRRRLSLAMKKRWAERKKKTS
jgi:hypothetical protein